MPVFFFAQSKKHGQVAWAPWYVTRRHVRDAGCVILLHEKKSLEVQLGNEAKQLYALSRP